MAANVQSMCQYWKNFNLQELQKELDTTVTDLAKRQDESDVSRRRLVEQSREFKKNTPEDIRKVVAALLKSFQIEVDNLSKRSKSAEAAFLSVYKKLINLPDPVSALEYAIQIQKKAHRVTDLEIENKQLRETLEEYNHEFAEVKNQEVTIKQLKDKIKEYEEKLETTAELRTKEKERELQRFFAEKERQLQETQLAVARKLGEAEQKISTLHAALEAVQSELFEVKSKYDEATSAKSDEMDMVISDVERANERAAAAERQVEQLRQQLASASQTVQQAAQQMQKTPDVEQAMDILKRSSMEVEITAKEKEISQLVEDVQRLQASLSKLRESTTIQISKLEEEISSKNTAFRLLEEKLRTQEDYEEIKRELNIMKSVEFSGVSSDEDQKSKSLEKLLLEKNKSLQTENTQLKVTNSDITGTETPKTPSSPSTSQQSADVFATILGEEIAQSYHNSNPPSRNPSESIESSPSASGLPPDTPPVSHPGRSDTPHFLPPPPVFGFPNCHIPQGFMPVNMTSKGDNSGGLDTSMVAKTVRELLSIHNIGQRLFAKHVLGLSQGTVSELLSKPKTWDKLTEKGRESYRKMFAWANEDRNILALKAISPKKGKNCTQPLVSTVKSEDSATEERIAQILNDAQQAMQVKKNMEQQQVANAVVSSIYQQEVSKMVGSSPLPQNMVPAALTAGVPIREGPRRRTTDDSRHSRSSVSSQESEASAQDMVARIYRQELEKLAKAAESAGNIAASTMYQQELARVTYHSHFKQSLNNLNHEFHFPGPHRLHNGVSVKSEPPDSTSDDTRSPSSSSINNNNNNGPIDLSKPHSSSSAPTSPKSADAVGKDACRQAGSAFFLVHPRINGHDGFENGQFPPQFAATLDGLSPLQRMQNIANSLSSRPHLNVAASKPLRAVLPPITQEQFDEYSNVNTDDLVKKVKETLSQYSISQRLFGENVLGLSQGSVSDLLARPKPWHMLTQKGREPFIRMQLFLEDAEAIPKLVASQYKIPPDMLLRGISHPVQEANVPVSLSAHRRRKNSMEDRYFDSPGGHAKRPRVFFTEEQKDALRVAYSEDPYPSQSTIEALAGDLSVGVKTVINWFHNHRMRAKQQHHTGANPDELSSVKSEPMDDSSNQSDGSSGSGEPVEHFRGSFQNNETRQWMFPQFEPVQRSKHDGSEGENSQHSDSEENPGGGGLGGKKEQELLCDAGISDNEDEVDSGSMPKSLESEKTDSSNSENNVPCSMPAPPPSGVNKRKRSNPQRVYEGAQLDKTKALQNLEQNDVPDNNDDGLLMDSKAPEVNGEVSSDLGSRERPVTGDDRFNKIVKLEKAIELAEEEWEEFDRDASIEKLEKNIETNTDEDWEF
ncbi:homeobox protein cut-like 1 isoform X2 [Gigantopelta aegis]|uniref:homeobox protein cut-like 1 isoform X2 n=1 Tax=Gigantopelta aegis TaxID=1735272 RepID=UPI001B888841|nr:homeobox protein cut-like 1 isoform X2 [Gigantopelta aegis]